MRSERQKNGLRKGAVQACLFVLAAAALVALSAPAAVAGDSVDDVIQAVEKHYAGLRDMTARITQKNHLRSLDRTQIFSGTLAIRKPGMLRIDYVRGQRIVIDGSRAWFYSEKSRQVIKRTFEDFERANIPIAFLLGAASIRDDFEVSRPDPKSPRLLDLKPKRGGSVMARLRISVDAAGRITELVIHDRSGNTSTVSFTEIREDAGVDEGLFRFYVPEGTEIIEQ